MTFVVNKCLDWLSITTHSTKAPDWIIGTSINELPYSPLPNYEKASQGNTGAIICQHSQKPELGLHIILSGETLGILRGEGHTDIEICQFFESEKSSRIDIAVTAENINRYRESLTPSRIAKLAASGKMKSKMKPDNGVVSPDSHLETAYIGSRASRNRLLKIYDKGVELGDIADKIIRYELQTNKNAMGVVRAVAQGLDIGGIIRRYVDFPECHEWITIMNSESVRMPQLEDYRTAHQKRVDKNNDRWHWLLTSVAPALAKALVSDAIGTGKPIEQSENLRLFNIRVEQIIEDIKNGKIPL